MCTNKASCCCTRVKLFSSFNDSLKTNHQLSTKCQEMSLNLLNLKEACYIPQPTVPYYCGSCLFFFCICLFCPDNRCHVKQTGCSWMLKESLRPQSPAAGCSCQQAAALKFVLTGQWHTRGRHVNKWINKNLSVSTTSRKQQIRLQKMSVSNRASLRILHH